MGKTRPIGRRSKLERFLEEHEVLRVHLDLMAGKFGSNRFARQQVEKTIRGICETYERDDLVRPLIRYYERKSGYEVGVVV